MPLQVDTKKLEEIKENIRNNDEKTREIRAKRQIELGQITIRSFSKNPPTQLHTINEAGSSYVNNNFRSCIFSASSTVEKAFMHELIMSAEDKERTYWEIILDRKNTFGVIIKKARNNDKLNRFITKAEKLNEIRNSVSAHPLYVNLPRITDGLNIDELIWKNKTIINDIKATILLLDEPHKAQVLSMTLHVVTDNLSDGSNVSKTIKLIDMLKDPTEENLMIIWEPLQKDILEHLALKSYRLMSDIINGLYGDSPEGAPSGHKE